jgi:hypothetical protein
LNVRVEEREITRLVGEVGIPFSDFPGRDPGSDDVVANVFGYYGAGANDRPPADPDTGQDDGPGAYPGIVFDRHRFGHPAKIGGLGIVGQSMNQDLMGNVYIVADLQGKPAIQVALTVDNGVVPDLDAVPGDEAVHVYAGIPANPDPAYPAQIIMAESVIGNVHNQMVAEIIPQGRPKPMKVVVHEPRFPFLGVEKYFRATSEDWKYSITGNIGTPDF